MILRRQLAVASPIAGSAVARAAFESVFAARALPARARALVADRLGSPSVLLTDSGTSALVLALRLTVPPRGVIGLPGFACVDLAAAARFADVRVRLYDLDPVTLSPDLDSVDRMLRRGVDAVVVAHLFGYAADVPGVRERASQEGVPVIEDAAQGAGGILGGRPLGSHGDLTVMSFGRGKGLCAGGGGAVAGFGVEWATALDVVELPAPGLGWTGLAKTAIQWALGRPSIYILPASIPWLRLGETVYRPAGEPRSLSRAAGSLLRSAFTLEDRHVAARRLRARTLHAAARVAKGVVAADEIPGARGGYLRFAVRDVSGGRAPAPRLGVLRSYPMTLAEQPEMAPLLLADEPEVPGAADLRRSLFTLPTHHFVSDSDLAAIARWMRPAGASSSRPLGDSRSRAPEP